MRGKLIRNIMRAVRVSQFGGPEVLKVETDVPIPKPADNQVLIRVRSAGVNPVDTYIRSGTYALKPPLPYTPGSDSAGIVEEVGNGVEEYKKGDRVFTVKSVTGTCAEFTVADKSMIGALPDSLTFEQGAGLGIPCYTAYRAVVLKGQAAPGQTVLIHGASGAVGIGCVQICKARNLTVLGTAGSQEGVDLVTSVGATAAFNHRQEGYDQQIMAATNGKGPDLIIEMLANVNLQRDLQMINRHGRIVVVGNRGNIEINPRDTMMKECTITGMLLMGASPDEWVQMHAGIQAGLNEGWLKPHICKTYKLEEMSAAHHDVINAASTLGKRVVSL